MSYFTTAGLFCELHERIFQNKENIVQSTRKKQQQTIRLQKFNKNEISVTQLSM